MPAAEFYSAVRGHVQRGELPLLADLDQLKQAQASGAAFADFREGALTFEPTYKYDVGTTDYDTSEKRRAPAWCDRVLWRCRPGSDSQVACLYYGRYELTSSDHRPVGATLELQVAVPDAARKLQVQNDIYRTLDTWENECMPLANLERAELSFGRVSFGHQATETALLVNEGKTTLQFCFVRASDDGAGDEADGACPPWLHLNPRAGLLLPGEAVSISATIDVQPPEAGALNYGEMTLDSILLLRLRNGRDFYLTVTAEWQRTCLGARLDSPPPPALHAARSQLLATTRKHPSTHKNH